MWLLGLLFFLTLIQYRNNMININEMIEAEILEKALKLVEKYELGERSGLLASEANEVIEAFCWLLQGRTVSVKPTRTDMVH